MVEDKLWLNTYSHSILISKRGKWKWKIILVLNVINCQINWKFMWGLKFIIHLSTLSKIIFSNFPPTMTNKIGMNLSFAVNCEIVKCWRRETVGLGVRGLKQREMWKSTSDTEYLCALCILIDLIKMNTFFMMIDRTEAKSIHQLTWQRNAK